MTVLSRFWRLLAVAMAAVALHATPSASSEPTPVRPDRQILVMVSHPPDHFRPNAAYSGAGYGDQLAQSSRERLARKIAGRHGLSLVDAWPMPMIGYDCFVMSVPDGRSTSQAVEDVSHDSDVAWAEPVQIFAGKSAPVPNDPLFAAEPAAHEWHLADLQRISTGRGVKVAVIDSAVDPRHPDLAGQLALRLSFVAGKADTAEQHGTSVAGIIAAKANNGIGIAGVAPGARILALRACWQENADITSTVCDSFSLAKALYFAIHEKTDIINLSLAGPDDRLLRELLKVATSQGLTVVTAFDPRRQDGGFPADVPGVIAVSDMPVAAGQGRVYIAPGRGVPTTEPGGRWFLVNGSSFAAAHVSGLVALMRQRQRSSALTLIAAHGGPIDACATLTRAVGDCACECGPATSRSRGGH